MSYCIYLVGLISAHMWPDLSTTSVNNVFHLTLGAQRQKSHFFSSLWSGVRKSGIWAFWRVTALLIAYSLHQQPKCMQTAPV